MKRMPWPLRWSRISVSYFGALAFGLSIVLLSPHLHAQLPPPQATLDLEWEVVEDADAYELKLTPEEGGEPLRFTTNENKISQRVPVGIYQLQIRSRDKASGYFGSWSGKREIEVTTRVVELIAPADGAQLADPKDRRKNVAFEWAPLTGAKQYLLRVWSDDESKAREFHVRGTSKELSLPTGRVYYWQVTFESEKDVTYRATPNTFSFDLLGPQLLQPVVDRKIEFPYVTHLAWSRSPGADFYKAKLTRRYIDESAFHDFKDLEKSEDNFWKFERLPPGGYRIEVTAQSNNRVSSEPGFYEFNVKPTAADVTRAMASVSWITPEEAPTVEAAEKSETTERVEKTVEQKPDEVPVAPSDVSPAPAVELPADQEALELDL